ncbi:hypothetical protein ABZ883_36985 [Streptomyces sp. NPDC046977]|uniref:hypothetical protein n=1 Tax=Streptomyces sp. NPDC046977 TaxID=3154703 RepID=UPI0033C9D8AE
MPKRQTTAAQMTRLRQAETGERYTEALRAVLSPRGFEFEQEVCCLPIEVVISDVRAQFDQGGVPALLEQLEELRESIGRRSPHHDVFSGHAVVLAVYQVHESLLYRVSQQGVASEPPLLSEAERRQIARAVRGLEDALARMVAEEHRD